MNILDRVLNYGKSVELLNERILLLQNDVQKHIALTGKIDRRLVTLETFFGIVKQNSLKDQSRTKQTSE